MSLHRARQTSVRLPTRLVDEAALEEDAKCDRDEDDHQRAADELAEHELPAEQQRDHDPELEYEVRGGDLERNRRREIGTTAKERARKGNRGVGAGGRGGAEAGGDGQRPGRVVRKQTAHLALRHHRLHGSREGEAEDQCPEDLPEHPERERQRIDDLSANGRDHRLRVKRRTASISSAVFSFASAGSPEAIAPATQWLTWSSRISSATDSSAVETAEICVRMSMQ